MLEAVSYDEILILSAVIVFPYCDMLLPSHELLEGPETSESTSEGHRHAKLLDQTSVELQHDPLVV